MDRVNLAEKLALFGERWSPKVGGEPNGQHVRLVKLLGEFVWHRHDHEDEVFLVVRGRFRLGDRAALDAPGHDQELARLEPDVALPELPAEAHVLLFEAATTLNTGEVRGERTVDEPERI